MNKHGYNPLDTPLNDELNDDFDSEIELDELDFSDDEIAPSFDDLETEPDLDREDILARVNEAGLTEAALPGHGPTDDDLAPETLIHEDGALSPYEPGGDEPEDQHLSIVNESEIGSGDGLDEAELARVHPLDHKRWDGNPNEPLSVTTTLDGNFLDEEENENLDIDEDADETDELE